MKSLCSTLLVLLASTCGAPGFAAQLAAEPAQGVVSDTYVIGPGDTVQIFVWRNPDLTVTIPVRPDGKISAPLVEEVVAAGKQPSQLAREIESVLGEYIKSPQVNIIVTQAASVIRQVKVIGSVGTPSSIPYSDGMKVLDAVLAAGGLGEFAAGNRAKLVRTEGGRETEIRIRLSDLVTKGDLDQNLPLRPGDVIVVPASRL